MAFSKLPSNQRSLHRDYDVEAVWPRPLGTPNAFHSMIVRSPSPEQDMLYGKLKPTRLTRIDYKDRLYGTFSADSHEQPRQSHKGRDPSPHLRDALHVVFLVLRVCAAVGIIGIIIFSICIGANALCECVPTSRSGSVGDLGDG